nr:reverse transcriptase domain-containing protein [Tanacetum cinerariifolium]
MDQILEQLVGNEYYCFLDGFSGYFQIPIDPRDQEKQRLPALMERSPTIACLSVCAMRREHFKVACRINLRRTSITGFPAQSSRSSDAIATDLPYLLVLNTGASQSRQHESRKPPTAELFDVDSRRISIRHLNRVDVIDVTCEDFVQDILDFQYNSKSSNPTLVFDNLISENDSCKVPIVKSSSLTLTPFGES